MEKATGREDQCWATNSNGTQCIHKRVEGSNYCEIHGANSIVQEKANKEMYKFKLAIYKDRLNELNEDEDLSSLKNEIGLLRILVEERFNSCNDTMDLVIQSGPISDLIIKIKSTIESFNKMETKLGNLLDKQAILSFAQSVIQIIGEELKGEEDKMNIIANRIMDALK